METKRNEKEREDKMGANKFWTIKQLKGRAQNVLNAYDLADIKNHNEFHAFMRKSLGQLFEGTGLTVGTWDVNFACGHDDKVFTYDREFIKDARCRWADKGKFSKPTIKLAEGMDETILVGDLEAYFKERLRQKLIAHYNKEIEIAKMAIETATEKLAELKKKGA